MIDFNFKDFSKSFKTLRLDRGYSINDLADNILSPSALRKFEEGLVDPSFTKVLMLLDKMHLGADEFIKFSLPNYFPEYKAFLMEVGESYNDNDVKTMKRIYQRESDLFKENSEFFYLISASTVAALIKNLEENFVIERSIIDNLSDYLMKVEIWGDFQILIFGNCSMIIPSKTIYLISKELFHKTKKLRSINDNLHNTIAALENGIEITSDRREYELARELLDLLSDFNIPSDELLLRFKFSFFKNLFFKKQAEAVKLNHQLIEALRLMNSNQLASAYDEYMSTFYQNKIS